MKTGLFNGGPEASPFRQGHFSFVHKWLQEVGALDALLAQLGTRIERACFSEALINLACIRSAWWTPAA